MRITTPLALLACSCITLAASSAMAQSVTIYGRLALTTNQVDTGGLRKVTELRDNASRLGFRGVEDMGGGLFALYGIELGFSADSGALTDPAARNSYVGLRGRYGTIAMGRLDSANPTGSPIYSQIIALSHFAPNDAGATATSASMQNARNRTSDSIGYASPKMGGFLVRARIYQRGAGTVAEPEDAARSLDFGVEYEGGPLKAGVAFGKDRRRGGLANNEFDDKWQAGVNYQITKGWDVALVGGKDRYKNTSTRRRNVPYWMIGTAYQQGGHKVVFNVFERDVQASLTGERKRVQLSYQYFLSRRTDLQAFIDNDGIDSSRPNVRVRAIGMGVRHNF